MSNTYDRELGRQRRRVVYYCLAVIAIGLLLDPLQAAAAAALFALLDGRWLKTAMVVLGAGFLAFAYALF